MSDSKGLLTEGTFFGDFIAHRRAVDLFGVKGRGIIGFWLWRRRQRKKNKAARAKKCSCGGNLIPWMTGNNPPTFRHILLCECCGKTYPVERDEAYVIEVKYGDNAEYGHKVEGGKISREKGKP